MKITLTLLFYSILCVGFSQEIQRDVVATSGANGSNESTNLSWTIGQIVTTKGDNSSLQLTSGFQQGTISVTAISEMEDSEWINIYPNPIVDNVTIKTTSIQHNKLNIEVLTLDGKKIIKTQVISNEHILDLSNLPQGTYLMTLMDNNKPIKTYKLVKQ